MTNTLKTLEHEGWTFTVQEGEPLVSDEVLAERLGMALKDLRALIRRHANQTVGTVSGTSVPHITPIPNPRTVRRFTKAGKERGSIVVEGFLLTQEDVVFLVTRSEAPRAIAWTKVIVRVFLWAQLQLRAALPPPDSEIDPEPDPHEAYLKARTFEKYDPIVQRARRKESADEKTVQTLHRVLVPLEYDCALDDATMEALIPEMLGCLEQWRTEGRKLDEVDERDILRLFSRIAAHAVHPNYDEKLTFAEMQEAKIQAREAREQRLQDELQRANAKIRELENALPEASASPAPTLWLVPPRR